MVKLDRTNTGTGFDLRTTPSNRGDHPDLADDALPSDPDERFDHQFWHDEQFRERYQQQQQQYFNEYFPPEVQEDTGSRVWGSRPSEGKREFNAAVRASFDRHKIIPPWAAREEYEKYFDDSGQPKEGWRKHRLEGEIDTSHTAYTDPYSAAEARSATRRSTTQRAQPAPPTPHGDVTIDRTRPGPYR